MKSEKKKLVEFFRDEGYALGVQGDNSGWSPAETAIEAMRFLRRMGHETIVPPHVDSPERKAEVERLRGKYAVKCGETSRGERGVNDGRVCVKTRGHDGYHQGGRGAMWGPDEVVSVGTENLGDLTGTKFGDQLARHAAKNVRRR